ncbi:unnamed protein product [Phytomonas sp. Hart1]|nr:unnamed protein product [Phytomonas sp. Hart1]|eukprot:CCW68003.1 unnamed protein product [Phytomonas sp. isolate Hart1]
MFKRAYYRAGSYLLNQRVLPDLWQPFYREEVYRRAKQRLNGLCQTHDDAADRGEAGVPFQISLPPGMAEAEAMDSFSPSATPEDDSAPFPPALSADLTMREADGLVGTFLSLASAEDLSATLQYLREGLKLEIAGFHYHALFRIFNHAQDRGNAIELVDLMARRGDLTPESYARAIDCVHSFAPQDALDRILAIVRLAQERFGGLIFDEVAGSEAATVSAFAAGRPEAPATSEAAGPPPRSSPVLTALLHHLSVLNDASSPLAALLIAVWVRALGVRLSDWDYVFICTALLTRVETFPRVCRVYGVFSEFPTGSVSPQGVFERLRERQEGISPSSLVFRLVEAMRDGLEKAGVDLAKPVEVGVVNLKTIGMQSWMNKILNYVVFHEGGLGSRRYNPGILYHMLSLLYSTVRDDKSAADMLLLAVEHKDQVSAPTPEGRVHHDKADPLRPNAEANRRLDESCGSSPTSCEGESYGEPFSISFHHVQDVGGLLPRLSQRTRNDLHDVFNRLVHEVVAQYQHNHEPQGREFDDWPGPAAPTTASPADARSAQGGVSLLSPARPLSASEVAGCEGYTLGVLHPTEEAREVLRQVISQGIPSTMRVPRETQLIFRQLAQYCGTHPLPNRKLTPTGLEERRRWGKYLDARDTSLALFGSSPHARDSMKDLYYSENTLAALRSDEIIMHDITEVGNIFFPPNADPDESEWSSPWRSTSPSEARQWVSHRTTLPHIRCSSHLVPPHLYDPNVYNPYPHIALKISPMGINQEGNKGVSEASDASSTSDDFFAELWSVLTNAEIMGRDFWYLYNTHMYMLLMRCFLHRLDWEAAAHLTIQMQDYSSYTYLMDHELTSIFKEIGDPAGCLAFKVATGLFDGRIMHDGQVKRKQFHMELSL